MSSFWTGKRVRLRGVEPADWEVFQSFTEHSADQRAVDRLYPPRSAAWFQEATAARAKQPGTDLDLAIESLETGELVGSLSTHGVDRRAGRFGYGIGIGHQHQRNGYAAEAVVLLLRYMFGEQRMHKCEAKVYEFNEPSLGLHRSLGFTEEGRLRAHEFLAGRHWDAVLLGMTLPEFVARWELPQV
ncbi:GNAT family N-acetyltransferase [Actinokineospora globicatena]|uniref:GNAT family N-acetyltransferase n=1 Tax=Actinokineospora globicatena TaxID=103729 RepID=UPI0020A50B1F|nr:GNAT family protein [Actinokineospora globicatena]MCP2306301.1 Protein N-acetyltransferase, RimJ/RimL family [Actinokineospora globicatena]GLW81726.1 N-acetyltransferase [Actinokineospora globicatena]GLW88521.1 N-acetyltransferase [Actinokineospora globicatena]